MRKKLTLNYAAVSPEVLGSRLTASEAAKVLGLTALHVNRLIATGKIEAFVSNGMRFIKLNTINDFVEARSDKLAKK